MMTSSKKMFVAAAACLLAVAAVYAQEPKAAAHAASIAIPKSLVVEHKAIHDTLVEATKAPGKVGEAAQSLAEVLHPHFVREEEIALPPLGLLQRLAAGTQVPKPELDEALRMTDALRKELPQMLEQHKAIRAAVEKLHTVATAAGAAKYVELAEELAAHAQSEEEVLYPAAVLVGDIIRARVR